jgi:tripartite-type tricarboxylate transporter receptor subunit TctC
MRVLRPLAALSVAPLILVTACADDGSTGSPAGAGDYPERSVRFLVPYSAGGPTDIGARALMPCFEEALGGSWVVENLPGAGGALALGEIANAEPDGYTIGVGSQSTFVTTPLIAGDSAYTYEDFSYAGQMMEFPSVWLVGADSPYQTMEDLLEAARSDPDGITVGTSGAQVSFSLATEQLADRGYNFTVVPFQGTAEANTAILGGNVDARWEAADTSTLELIEGGEVRPLATGAEERLSILPDVPPLSEAGVDDVLDTRTFYGVVGPKELDPAIADVLTETLETCVSEDEEYRSAIGEAYAQYAGPDELLERLDSYHSTVSEILE